MKLVGFLERYDKVLAHSKYCLEFNNQYSTSISVAEKINLIKFLSESNMILSKTWALYDGENYIGPYMIFSDGEWIWPSYFSYYLAKQELISNDLLLHLRQKNYAVTLLSREQIKEVTFFLEKEMLNI